MEGRSRRSTETQKMVKKEKQERVKWALNRIRVQETAAYFSLRWGWRPGEENCEGEGEHRTP